MVTLTFRSHRQTPHSWWDAPSEGMSNGRQGRVVPSASGVSSHHVSPESHPIGWRSRSVCHLGGAHGDYHHGDGTKRHREPVGGGVPCRRVHLHNVTPLRSQVTFRPVSAAKWTRETSNLTRKRHVYCRVWRLSGLSSLNSRWTNWRKLAQIHETTWSSRDAVTIPPSQQLHLCTWWAMLGRGAAFSSISQNGEAPRSAFGVAGLSDSLKLARVESTGLQLNFETQTIRMHNHPDKISVLPMQKDLPGIRRKSWQRADSN